MRFSVVLDAAWSAHCSATRNDDWAVVRRHMTPYPEAREEEAAIEPKSEPALALDSPAANHWADEAAASA
jgi:hypothetical protein